MKPTKSKIQDQTFLFTGTLTQFTRDEAEALVETHGSKVLSGVTAKLNYLVVGDKYWVINFKNGDHKEFFERVDNVLRPIKPIGSK